MSENYDAIIIGSGKGGKTLAVDLGNHGVKAALIERSAEMIGGSCINVACIPSKTFIASARAAHTSLDGAKYGIHNSRTEANWLEVRERVEGVVRGMRAMNEKNFHAPPNLDFIIGTGRFLSARQVEVAMPDGKTRQLEAAKIFINTGTRPACPRIEGIDEIGSLALNSNTVQRLDALPPRLIILGGGYIALEFAQLFRRLGSQVTIIERGSQIASQEDAEVAQALTEALRGEQIEILLETVVERVENGPAGGVAVSVRTGGGKRQIAGSHVLVALGRAPVIEELNLAAAGVELDAKGFVKVNERLETNVPGIWAIGDITGGPQFTHASLDDYRILKTNVFGNGNRSTKDRLIPFCLFTEPELARVGLTEKEARARGLDIRVLFIPASVIPRAKTSGRTVGLLKAIADAKSGRILGCTIFADSAGESISTVQTAMLAGLPATHFRDAILTHPTMTEGLNNLFASI